MTAFTIRDVSDADAEKIVAIYNPYISGTTVSFEEEPVTVDEMRWRMQAVHGMHLPWLCAEVNGELVGYAYASRWRERSAYRYTAESTIYLDHDFIGQQIGGSLYAALLDRIRESGMHMVIGVITLPNPASVALHEKMGFIKSAHFSEVGYKFNTWLDVGYWQKQF